MAARDVRLSKTKFLRKHVFLGATYAFFLYSQVASLTAELRGNKDTYMDELREENQNYINDNTRLRVMVHMFHEQNPTRCPGCRSGPGTAPVCPACKHILVELSSM